MAAEAPDPLSPNVIRSFFAKDGEGVWRCTAGETDEFECKEGFNLKGFGRPLKTIAGFANRMGGYVNAFLIAGAIMTFVSLVLGRQTISPLRNDETASSP